MGLARIFLTPITGFLIATAAAAECPAGAGPAAIQSVHVAGSSLSNATLSFAYASAIGKPDTPASRGAVAQAIAAAYGHSDVALYDVSFAPHRECGIIGISVVEGHVDRVVLRGTLTSTATRLIDRYLARIIAERPLHISTLQRYLSLIRDIAGLRSKVEFEQTDRREAVRMLVTVSQSRSRIGASIDNRGTKLTGTTEFQATASLYDMVRGGDQLDIALFTTKFPSRLLAASGSYTIPVGGNGTKFSALVAKTKNDISEYSYRSSSIIYGIIATLSIIKSYKSSIDAGIELRYLKSETELLGYDYFSNDGFLIEPKAVSDIVLPNHGEMAISMTAAFGRIRQSSRFVNLSPARGSRRITVHMANYRKLDSNLILRVKGVAQIGTRNLPNSEQLVLGGSDYGRAFANGFIAGDSGFATSGELAVRLVGRSGSIKDQSEAYAFVDGGQLDHHDPLFLATDREKLISSGIGLRVGNENRASLTIEAAAGSARLFGADKPYRRLSIGIHRFFF